MKKILAFIGIIALVLLTSQTGVGVAAPSERSAQGAPGTWVSSVTIQNPNATATDYTLEFYDASGNLIAAATQSGSIAAGQSAVFYLPNIAGLANGQYSALVSSTLPVLAITNLSSSGPVTGGSYDGFSSLQTATSFFVPGVYKSYFGYTSNIVVQNADATDASVTVTYKNAAGAVVYTTPATTVKPNASATFDQGTTTQLPAGFIGSAIVDGGGKKIAAILNTWSSSNSGLFSSTNGFAGGATVGYLPVIMNNYFGFLTSFMVQNVDSAPADILVSYSNGMTKNATIPAGSSKLYYQPNDGLPNGFMGAVTVTSTNGKNIAVLVNTVRTSDGRFSSYNGFTSGSTEANLPVVMNNYYGWVTSVTIQNVDTAPADVLLTYSNGMTKNATIAAGASKLYYQPNDGLPSGFIGAIKVTSTNGKKIVAVVNEENQGSASAGDQLMTYNGFGPAQ